MNTTRKKVSEIYLKGQEKNGKYGVPGVDADLVSYRFECKLFAWKLFTTKTQRHKVGEES